MHSPDTAELRVAALALHLGAAEFGGRLSEAERALVCAAADVDLRPEEIEAARQAHIRGEDPFAEPFQAARSRVARRLAGAIYTPPELVGPMVRWAVEREPARVVDPGCGSGRFAAAVARTARDLEIVAVDVDPLATLMTRAALAVAGHARSCVLNADYLRVVLPTISGTTAFVGNPPYVRHHDLDPATKAWAQSIGRSLGLHVSGRAGLHALFLLATALLARPGDAGCFVTSSEWLDVNYGRTVRSLLTERLGAEAVFVVAPQSRPFDHIDVTASIICFRTGGAQTAVRFGRIADASTARLGGGIPVSIDRLRQSERWGQFAEPQARPRRPRRGAGHVELGELCAVHRGMVTGSNAVWVGPREAFELPPAVLYPAVTHARELFAAGERLSGLDGLRVVVGLPADLEAFDAADRTAIERFLASARARGADRVYVASNRRPWWQIRMRPPAPILASYMARRPPAFVRNIAGARHLNIAHGIYPRVALSEEALDGLVAALRTTASLDGGRTYAGGLTKFEPREMERLLVPEPQLLESPERP